MKNKIIALSVLLSILSGGCVNMQQSKDLLTIDVTKDYPQKEFALQDIFDIDYIPFVMFYLVLYLVKLLGNPMG